MIKLNIINEDASSSIIFWIDGGGYDDILAELSNRSTNGMYKLKSICFGGPSSERCICVDYVSKETADEIRTHINDQENAFDGCGLDSLWSEADDIQNAKSYLDDDMWKAIASVKDIRDFVVSAVQDGYGEFFESEFDDFVSNIEDGDKKSINVAKKVADVLGVDISDYFKDVEVNTKSSRNRRQKNYEFKSLYDYEVEAKAAEELEKFSADKSIADTKVKIKKLYDALTRRKNISMDEKLSIMSDLVELLIHTSIELNYSYPNLYYYRNNCESMLFGCRTNLSNRGNLDDEWIFNKNLEYLKKVFEYFKKSRMPLK